MKPYACILGPVQTGEGPVWFGLAFSATGEALAHTGGRSRQHTCAALAQELWANKITGSYCEPALEEFAREHNWEPKKLPFSVLEGRAIFAMAMANGPDGMQIPPVVYEEIIRISSLFWKSKPWDEFGEKPFRITVEGEKQPRVAVCMGRLGENYGTSIFDNEDDYERFCAAGTTNDVSSTDGISQLWLSFEDEPDWIASAVQEIAEVPGYPSALRVQGWEAKVPSAQDICILLGSASILAEFSAAREQELSDTYLLPGTDLAARVRVELL